jgi:hypothetical protein
MGRPPPRGARQAQEMQAGIERLLIINGIWFGQNGVRSIPIIQIIITDSMHKMYPHIHRPRGTNPWQEGMGRQRPEVPIVSS